jgi:ABC-type nitrate/sulfonate/bicarbonate transport system permease component
MATTSEAMQNPPVISRRSQDTWLDRLLRHPNLIRIVSVFIFFACWEYFGRNVNPLFLVGPSRIAIAAWELWNSGELQRAIVQTSYPFFIGMAITIVGGIVIGFAMAQWRLVEYILDPFVNAFYAIPRIALVPLVILWAGLGVAGKVSILVSIAIFPVVISTFAGIRDVRGSLIEIGRAYAATPTQIFFKIVLPAAIPFVMTGIRLAVGLGIIGIVVGEFFTALSGLGGMIVNYANLFQTAKMFVPIVVLAAIGAVLTELVAILERRLSRWRALERGGF